MRTVILFISLIFCSFSLFAQLNVEEEITLFNPSFEDTPQCCQAPAGWIDCGWKSESAPDVQPRVGDKIFAVTQVAFDGDTYLGMVVRENDTWERVSQRLSSPLQEGKCYTFSIKLCTSENYLSANNYDPNKLQSYTTPAVLRIWGGSGYCNERELLGESETVSNSGWKSYEFTFEPSQNMRFIMLEAFYKTPTLFPYNGNILLDDATSIVLTPCPDEEVLAKAEPKEPEPKEVEEVVEEKPVEKEVKEEVVVAKVREEPKPREVVAAPKIMKELDVKKLRKGQVIKIKKLFFEADTSSINMESYEVLDELYSFLATNEDVVLEVGGHTNGTPPTSYCDRLSRARAKSVVEYLQRKGIEENRLVAKGYGKRKPIATNATVKGRTLNQRVEIKILSLDG